MEEVTDVSLGIALSFRREGYSCIYTLTYCLGTVLIILYGLGRKQWVREVL